jgi:hypothetical protein
MKSENVRIPLIMGGLGSGRRPMRFRENRAEDHRRLDIRSWLGGPWSVCGRANDFAACEHGSDRTGN